MKYLVKSCLVNYTIPVPYISDRLVTAPDTPTCIGTGRGDQASLA